jgi:uncharacterized protein YjbI with pentapeptide repeats
MSRSCSHPRLTALLCASMAFAVWRSASAANADHVARFKSTHECPGCDLSQANQAPRAKLANANLTGASFYGGNLRGADLSGAMLDGADLEMVDLTGAVGAVLGGAKTDARTTCPDGNAGPCK